MSKSIYDDKAPDYRTLTRAELLALWKAHRNDTQGLMAADEIVRRIVSQEEKP